MSEVEELASEGVKMVNMPGALLGDPEPTLDEALAAARVVVTYPTDRHVLAPEYVSLILKELDRLSKPQT